MTVLCGDSADSPLSFPGQHGPLQGPHVGVSCTDAGQVSRYRVAGRAFPSAIEIDLAGFGVAYQRIDRTGRGGAATDRHTVDKGRDRGDVFFGEIEFRHALIQAAVLNNGCNQFAVVVVQNKFTADQIGTPLATARIGSVAETAICAENLAAARNHSGVGRGSYRIGGRARGYANRRGGRRLGRGLRRCLVGAGFLGRGGDGRLLCHQGCRAKPQECKKDEFHPMQNDLQAGIATCNLNCLIILPLRNPGAGRNEIHIRYANKELRLDWVFRKGKGLAFHCRQTEGQGHRP